MAREGFSSCAMTTTPPAKNTAGILREAMKLPSKNEKLMLRVFLLVLSPFSLLVLLHYSIAGPLIQKVEDSYETSTLLDPKDVRALIGIEIPFSLAVCFISFCGTSIAIHSSALIHNNKSTSLKELGFWILSTWKKQFMTSTYVLIIAVAYLLLSLVSLQLTSLVTPSDASYVFSWGVGILAASFYLYLASVLILALVISTVEDDCFGAKAIEKARRLLLGRRIQASSLMLILAVLSIPIYVLFYVTTTDDDSDLGPVARFAFIFIATILFCLTNFFTLMVFTVFHFECKRSRGEDSETGFGPGYLLVSTVVDDPDNT